MAKTIQVELEAKTDKAIKELESLQQEVKNLNQEVEKGNKNTASGLKEVATASEKTAGGIIIPDTAQEKPMEGEVLEVGSGSRDEVGKLVPLDVKKGDKILFGKWSGTEVKMNGEEYLIMKESDIMGIINSTKKKK